MPVVRIEVDGANPFAAVRPLWRGWSPDLLFAEDDPLLTASFPRRVAVQICNCGFAGCGLIAVVITEADGLVHSDARLCVGRFERAARDRSWESLSGHVASLLRPQ